MTMKIPYLLQYGNRQMIKRGLDKIDIDGDLMLAKKMSMLDMWKVRHNKGDRNFVSSDGKYLGLKENINVKLLMIMISFYVYKKSNKC